MELVISLELLIVVEWLSKYLNRMVQPLSITSIYSAMRTPVLRDPKVYVHQHRILSFDSCVTLSVLFTYCSSDIFLPSSPKS
jgi:hypothetical protein